MINSGIDSSRVKRLSLRDVDIFSIVINSLIDY